MKPQHTQYRAVIGHYHFVLANPTTTNLWAMPGGQIKTTEELAMLAGRLGQPMIIHTAYPTNLRTG